MPQFHETGYGRIFFQSQLPELIKQLSRIADNLEEQNKFQQSEAPATPGVDARDIVVRRYYVYYETANESGKASEVSFPVNRKIPAEHPFAEYECARILEIPHSFIKKVGFLSEEETQ